MSSSPVILDDAYFAPYEAFVARERSHMLRMEENATAIAQHSFSSASSASTSTTVTPPVSLAPEVYGTDRNYMASAYTWAVQYTNEWRRLEAEQQEKQKQEGEAAKASTSSAAPDTSPSSLPSSFSTSNPVTTEETTTTTTTNTSTKKIPSRLFQSARLRMATPRDVSSIMGFIRELAEFEREPEAVITDEATMLRDGFTEGRQWHCIMLEVPREVYTAHLASTTITTTTSNTTATATSNPSCSSSSSSEWVAIAFAFSFPIYSTWQGRSIYIEDIYVQPAFRRNGLLNLFFSAICKAACISKCQRVQWSALAWNTPAINAYVSPAIRATYLDEWQGYRIYHDNISRIANLKDL